MLFIANSTIGSQNNSVELSQSNQTTRILIISWFKHVLSDPYVSMVFEWLMTPVVISFILPLVFCLIIWASSLVLYVHKYHKRRLMRRLREAVNERDIVIAGREIIAALWDAQGWLWHGYEVIGIEKIPEDGPALLVYYHGALPLDYYYLVAKVVLHKRRIINSVVDSFLFHIPGLSAILNVFGCTEGTVPSCAKNLSDGNLLGLSPGGVYEAMFSDHKKYNIQWKSRVGFAKIALQAGVPVIPIFTKNIREAVRTFNFSKRIMKWIYEKTRMPLSPLYGGWPVKLTTIVGDPIPHDPRDTPESLRDKVKESIEKLISENQRVPGSICVALFERFTSKRHAS